MKKVWTPAMRKAFAAKMKRARAAKRGRRKNPSLQSKVGIGDRHRLRSKNPKRRRMKRVERKRRKNPLLEYEIRMGASLKNLKLVWTTHTPADAKFIARTFAKANPSKYVTVKKK